MKRILALVCALALLFSASEAVAQSGPPQPLPASVLVGFTAMSVTSTSSRFAYTSVTSPFNAITIYNAGTKDAYIQQGDVTAVATTSNARVPAGAAVTIWASGAYLAAITGGSDTTTLYVYQANGPIDFTASGSSSGGGGAITGNVGVLNTSAAQIDPATSQRQDTGNTSLGTIATNTAGVATAANQTTGNTSAATTATNTGTTATNTGTIAGAVTSSVMQSNTKQVNGVTTQASAGAVGTGSQRIAVGQDTTTIAGSAPGTAGSASTNVLTIQGIAGGTVVPTAAAATTAGGAVATGCNAIVPSNTTGVLCGSAGAHQVYHFSLFNNSATVAYLKMYDKATAPTCGTDTPTSRRMIPANGGIETDVSTGAPFTLGVGYCVTTGIADNDTGAPAATTYLVNIYYK